MQSQQPPLSGKAYSHQGDGAQITIAPIILARNLDAAPRAVQIQALELLRTRRIFTRTSVQTAPKKAFLFVAVLARDGELGEDDNDEEDEETGDGQRRRSRLEAVDGDAGMGKGRTGRVTRHLNDHFFLSHHHDSVEEGFPNLDEAERRRAKKTRSRARDEGKGKGKERQSVGDDVETASTDSVVVKKSVVDGSDSSSSDDDGALHPKKGDEFGSYGPDSSDSSDDRDGGLFTESDISFLAQLARRAHIDSDVARYAANIISFLRLHRAVAGGVSPLATRHLDLLARCLAPLNGLDFVTPSLVAIAARKVYPHRIDLVSAPSAAGSGLINGRAATATAVEERSLQWGSDSAAVQAVLAGVEPEDVIEDVLSIVAAPL